MTDAVRAGAGRTDETTDQPDDAASAAQDTPAGHGFGVRATSPTHDDGRGAGAAQSVGAGKVSPEGHGQGADLPPAGGLDTTGPNVVSGFGAWRATMAGAA